MTITLTDQQVSEICGSRYIQTKDNLIGLIKELRSITNMGLYEAKTVAEIIQTVLGSGQQVYELRMGSVSTPQSEARVQSLRNLRQIANVLFPAASES